MQDARQRNCPIYLWKILSIAGVLLLGGGDWGLDHNISKHALFTCIFTAIFQSCFLLEGWKQVGDAAFAPPAREHTDLIQVDSLSSRGEKRMEGGWRSSLRCWGFAPRCERGSDGYVWPPFLPNVGRKTSSYCHVRESAQLQNPPWKIASFPETGLFKARCSGGICIQLLMWGLKSQAEI